MLETELRELFELQASAEQPPSRLDIQATHRAARIRLRIRRLTMTATPLVAVAAVAAIVLTSGPLVGRTGPVGPGSRHHRAQYALGPSAPRYFDPLREYLSFGWLPPKTRVVSGETGTTTQRLAAGRPGDVPLALSAYSAGQCTFARMRFHCAGQPKDDVIHLTRRLPDIDGHPAYLSTFGYMNSSGFLVWRYARDGWAELDFRYTSYAVRVAEHVIFGGPAAPLRYPVQLTGMPGWHLRFALFNPGRHGSLATYLSFATGAGLHTPGGSASLPGYPTVTTTSPMSCYFFSGYSTRSVIAGYPVVITIAPPGKLDGASHDVCAANANGLNVDVLVSGRHPSVAATKIFAHLKLFGPDPGNWTTQPVG